MTQQEAHGSVDRSDYVRSVMNRLYPSSGAPAEGTSERVVRYIVLPHNRSPRLVVPAGNRKASALAVRRQLVGRRPRTRAARLLWQVGLRTGFVDLLSRSRLRVSVGEGHESIEDVLARCLGTEERLLITMPVGPPRANRKPVLQVTNRMGDVLAFVKVGHDPLTSELVQREERALTELVRSYIPATKVPTVLGSAEWEGLRLLLLEPLDARPTSMSSADRRRRLVQSLRAVASTGTVAGTWEHSPARATLLQLLPKLGRRGHELRELVRLPEEHLLTTRVGAWHGDLNPGNFSVRRDETSVWDWERYEWGVPHGFDILHHDLHVAITVEHAPPRQAATDLVLAAGEILKPFSVPPAKARAVAQLYLAVIGCRYLRDRQDVAGSPLGRVEDWLVPALRATLG